MVPARPDALILGDYDARVWQRTLELCLCLVYVTDIGLDIAYRGMSYYRCRVHLLLYASLVVALVVEVLIGTRRVVLRCVARDCHRWLAVAAVSLFDRLSSHWRSIRRCGRFARCGPLSLPQSCARWIAFVAFVLLVLWTCWVFAWLSRLTWCG